MLDFQCKSSKTINGFEIKAYDVDPKFDDALKNLLKNKIQKIKLYDIEKYSDYLPADTTPEYREAFKKKLLSIAVPDNHKINWFNVKRTITTEFMSQLLLENNFNCIFHEEVDKRINVDPVILDKQPAGIDVVGIQKEQNELKFVICEVKASGDSKIPCNSSEGLLNDINNALDNRKRVEKEIFQYMGNLNSSDNETIKNIIHFLSNLLMTDKTENKIYESIVFYPFLIRNNERILNENNLNDFKDFDKEKLGDINLSGIIWSFNEDIDNFCINLYNEAIEEL